VQDAIRFLLRHYQTVSTWPLQVYSSAIVFSPATSVVRRENLDKIPHWLTNIPTVEEEWASLIQTLAGHSGMVLAVAFSPDGQRIASGSTDNTIKVWDATTGEVEKMLVGHSRTVKAVAFSPDGRRIVSGSKDRTIKVWDVTTGEVEKTLVGHSRAVSAVAFSPDGRRIVSGSKGRTIKVWDVTTRKVEKTLVGHSHTVFRYSRTVSAVAFSPDGQRIASGSTDNTIKVWDATTGEVKKTLVGHSGEINAVAFSSDGQRIVSGSWDYVIKVWDVTTGEVEKTLAGHLDSVTAVAFSADGRRITSGSWGETVKVWDATMGEVEKTLVGHSDMVLAVVFSPDGRRIASGSFDGTIKLWDVISLLKTSRWLGSTLSRRLRFRTFQEIEASGPVSKLRFSADGAHLTTDVGLFKVETTATEQYTHEVDSSRFLHVHNQWIHCNTRPILRLPAGFEAACYDVNGDQLAIGFTSGRVLSFTIDRQKYGPRTRLKDARSHRTTYSCPPKV
jgi:WD40 repeat protein